MRILFLYVLFGYVFKYVGGVGRVVLWSVRCGVGI